MWGNLLNPTIQTYIGECLLIFLVQDLTDNSSSTSAFEEIKSYSSARQRQPPLLHAQRRIDKSGPLHRHELFRVFILNHPDQTGNSLAAEIHIFSWGKTLPNLRPCNRLKSPGQLPSTQCRCTEDQKE